MRALWTTNPFDGLSFHPKPLQQPHPPIFIGGGVRHSAARAAALGDGWLPMSATLDELEAGIEVLHRELTARGRPTEGFPIANKLPAYEASGRATAHARQSGASAVATLNGDALRTLDYVERAQGLGVTHLWVELPVADRVGAAEQLADLLCLA
jgi:alkanesulfonate monooxygenase SsuD/methylene tetrahydromethanopterin reductase-like flavin-dependent oxidoreductase (luciferase family)